MLDGSVVCLSMEAVPSPVGVVVVMIGELDLANVGAATAVFDSVCDGASVVVDLAGLEFLGFAGVAMLRSVHRRLAVAGRRLSVDPISDAARRTFAIAGNPCTDRPVS